MAYPVLAPGDSWYKSDIDRGYIYFVDIYDYKDLSQYPIRWNADIDDSGSIQCALGETVITSDGVNWVRTGAYTLYISGNGSGKISLNEDSQNLFKDFSSLAAPVYTSSFTELKFRYLDVLDVSNCTNLSYAFANTKLKTIDIPDWNFTEGTSLEYMFNGCTSLITVNIGNWDTSKVTNFKGMFYDCSELINIDGAKFDVSNAEDLAIMFAFCQKLTTLDVSNWDISNAIYLYGMFIYCLALTSLDLSNWRFTTKDLVSLRQTFAACQSLTSIGDVSNWNFESIYYTDSTFGNCEKLTSLDVSKWDTSNVQNMGAMFHCCYLLKDLDVSGWETSNVTNMEFMFYSCSSLKEIDVSKWDVSKCTNFDHFAAHAYLKRKGIENWKTTSAENMNAMFHNTAETELDLSGYDTSKVKYFSQMFENSPNLRRIKGLEKWDTSQATGFDEMFGRCYALEELDLSSWDTSKAKNGDKASTNGHATGTFRNFIDDCRNLKKLVLGPKFKVNGDGTNTNASYRLVLPTPSADYHVAADGYWYDEEGNQYSPTGIEDGARTYYASPFFAKMANMTLVKKTTVIKIADYIRTKTGKSDKIKLSSIIDEFESILKNHVSND